eukprot:7380201-Prymnesium_polylepis.1
MPTRPSAGSSCSAAPATMAICMAMHKAVNQGDLDRLAELLREAPDAIDEADESGDTALMSACISGEVGCARLLCEAGAAVDQLNERGSTPLIRA